MTESWANASGERWVTAVTVGADLHLELRGPGLRTGLMDALREAVRTGRLTPGARLPSSRTLAADLGMARNTVADAYAELVAEGWLTARQGSGTRVARRAAPRTPAPSGPPARPVRRRPTHNLRAGTPDLGSFPRAEWLAASRRALTAAPNEALDYGDQLGRVELRTVLAGYLARTRGVYADPERVVLCSGFVHGLALMAQVLAARRGRTRAVVGVESYGLDFHRDILTAAGLRTPALALDELGTRTEELISGQGELRGVDAVLTTPAHQFPTGAALHPDRRAAMVDWARGAGGLILEDDYDGEFRYDRQPVDPTPWQLGKCPVQRTRKPRPCATGAAHRRGRLRGSAVQVPVFVQHPQRGHETRQRACTAGVLRERPRVPARQATDHPLMLRIGYRFAATAGALMQGDS